MPSIERELHDCCRAAFEQLCFMFDMPELAESQAGDPVAAVAEVRFRGGTSGRLVLETTAPLFAAAAAQMLGTGQTTLQQQQDAIGELANVICGNVLPALSRRAQRYSIGRPAIIRDIPGYRRRVAVPEASASVNFDQGRASVALYLDRRRTPGVRA